MPILKLLDLSTVHLSATTGKLLDVWAAEALEDQLVPVAVSDRKYGWFLPAGDNNDLDNEKHIPGDLKRVRAYAREKGCDYILLDADAERELELPIYEGNTINVQEMAVTMLDAILNDEDRVSSVIEDKIRDVINLLRSPTGGQEG